MKELKDLLTVENQISYLISKGIIINDVDYATDVLENISYYRLIKGFTIGLVNNDVYSGITFEEIVRMYDFNKKLRHLILNITEEIEIGLRTKIINTFGIKYGVHAYLDNTNFNVIKGDLRNYEDLKSRLLASSNDKSSIIVRHYKDKHECDLPIQALLEVCSFGTLVKFYKNMIVEDKKNISAYYNINYSYYENWIECFSHLRNVCAHYGRVYNFNFKKSVKLYKEYSIYNNNKLFAYLVSAKLLSKSSTWNNFLIELNELLNDYEEIDIEKIGFPVNWNYILTFSKKS